MEADYVIVGAGSAGCVLANRLSADPGNSVLLLEAGSVGTALSLQMPAAMAANLTSTKYNWAFQGEPEPGLGGRSIQHDRGKALGGSSSINGMVFIRGHARDFHGWRQAGCEGWGYADVLPYFQRMESYSRGADEFRGGDGPVYVQRPAELNPISSAFLLAGEQAGYTKTDDICGFRQEGFGLLDRTTYGGERWSTARAYLEPARDRNNLTVVTDARTERVDVENVRATGVTFSDHHNQQVHVKARKEVILCAGAIGSPQLLMLSGIGPASHLKDVGVDVILDLPGVGANLNDHPDVVLRYRCVQPVSIWPQTRALRKVLAGLQWLIRRDGVCASNHFEVVACVRSAAGVNYPDLQLCIAPIALQENSWEPVQEHAFQIHIGLMRAHSRGSVTLRDANPETPPKILINYLEDPRDVERMLTGIRLVRELVGQAAFDGLRGEEISPGHDVKSNKQLKKKLADAVNTQWHLSCAAKMGPETDAGAVVNAQGQVHGIRRLRVVDASIMPQVTNGNTNSPTIMMAEKLSDAILGKPPLPPVEARVWEHPRWEGDQR